MPLMPRSFKPQRAASPKDYTRDREAETHRLYGQAWRKARIEHLAASPLCRYCELEGRLSAADTVDHLYPHGGDVVVFWQRRFWVSCCRSCHDGFKQTVERAGKAALAALARRLGL